MNSSLSRILGIAVIVLALIGAANAAYVTYLTYWVLPAIAADGSLFCDINDVFSCSRALTLKDARIFGIPSCTIALFVYPIIAALGACIVRRGTLVKFAILEGLAFMGTLMNAYVIYQDAQANVYCLFCLFCGVIILSLLGIGIFGTIRSLPTLPTTQK